MPKAERLIGIDFGTSTSVVRTKHYQNREPIGDSFNSNGEGDTKSDTIVHKNADNSFTCGGEAEEPIPASLVCREFKMRLESDNSIGARGGQNADKAFFRYIFDRYDHQRSDLGELDNKEHTLVSVPVNWSQETRQFMAQAAGEAGFKEISVWDEPTAVLYAALCRKMNELNQNGLLRIGETGYLLLVDMGAGATDLAVCRYRVDGQPVEIIRTDWIKNEIVAAWPEDQDATTFEGEKWTAFWRAMWRRI